MLLCHLNSKNKIGGVNIKDFHRISMVGNVYMLMERVLANYLIQKTKKVLANHLNEP